MKSLVMQYDALDIRILSRKGYLAPFSKFDWVWRTAGHNCRFSVSITVLQDALQLLYRWGPDSVHQKVWLTYSIGAHGGKRPWFVCTTCRRRVGVLYHANERPFRCRTCSGLAYPSQYQSKRHGHGQRYSLINVRERENLQAQSGIAL